eukprot:9953242-Prorocentrum_lima.AAC.1
MHAIKKKRGVDPEEYDFLIDSGNGRGRMRMRHLFAWKRRHLCRTITAPRAANRRFVQVAIGA